MQILLLTDPRICFCATMGKNRMTGPEAVRSVLRRMALQNSCSEFISKGKQGGSASLLLPLGFVFAIEER